MNIITQFIKNTGMEIEEEGIMMDLVCGMELNKTEFKFKSEFKGKTYYFCSHGCKTHFDNNPEKYAE